MKQVLILLFAFWIASCTNDEIPREKAYQRFYFPKKEYKNFTSNCNFSFELPTYCYIENKDSLFQEQLRSDSCWINVVFPSWNGKLHISYKYYDNPDLLTKLLEDSYKLTSKHMVKASYIKDSIIDLPEIKGLVYSVGGNSASEKQFVLTDYKNQFVRGALYFNSTPNFDSMQPILEFVDKDIYHLIETFKFRSKP